MTYMVLVTHNDSVACEIYCNKTICRHELLAASILMLTSRRRDICIRSNRLLDADDALCNGCI